MKVSNLCVTLLSLAAIASANAAQPIYSSRIESQRGEKWWGVFAGGSPVQQPFEQPFETHTGQPAEDGIRVPVLVSNAGRYLWSPQPVTIGFDGNDFTIGSDHEKPAVQKGGKNLREAYLVCAHKNFTPDGTLPPVDLLAMPVYNTRIEFGFLSTQTGVLDFADKILDAKLPVGIILLADGWRSYDGGYDFDRTHFPDPRAMVEQLHSKGFKLMLTATPLTGSFGRPYAWGGATEMFVRGAARGPLVVETADGYGLCFDLARNEVAEYLRKRIENLRSAYGVDGFRFDCGAVIPELVRANTDPNRFLQNWRALGGGIELCEYLPGDPKPLSPTVHALASEAYSDWQGLRAMMCNVLSAGLAGFPYVHVSPSSIDPAGDAIMLRTLQLCVWMPVAEIPFAPWRIADPALRAEAEKTIRLRAQMSDYIAGLVRESARTGEPLLRHMEYQFPRNGFSDCNNQFMLGGKYLFAPVVDGQPVRTVRLPRGVWTDPDGRRFKGPVVTDVATPNGKLIWFELSGK